MQHYQYSQYKRDIKRIYEESFPKSEKFDFLILEQSSFEPNVHLSCILQNNNPVGMQFTITLHI